MDRLSLDVEEARVLGSLVEKGATTPDQYPMTLNGVRLACNQASNRDPVFDFDEATVERALRRLADRALAKMVHRPGDRVVKYRHALGDALELGSEAVAVIAVLLLRGTQTPGELRQRTTRYVDFASLLDVERVLDELAHLDPPLVERLGRRPGQKEVRYRHLLGDARAGLEGAATVHPIADRLPADAPRPAPAWLDDAPATPLSQTEPAADDFHDPARHDLADLAAEVDELRRRFERLLEELGVEDV